MGDKIRQLEEMKAMIESDVKAQEQTVEAMSHRVDYEEYHLNVMYKALADIEVQLEILHNRAGGF